jgi:hypothetical protein
MNFCTQVGQIVGPEEMDRYLAGPVGETPYLVIALWGVDLFNLIS